MNILPLICGLLIVFSCLAFNFIRDKKSVEIAEWGLTAAARTDREVKNRLEERQYLRVRTQPKAKPKAPEKEKVEKASGTTFSKRAIVPPPEHAKLCLTPLFESQVDLHNDPLYQVATRLLHFLYEGTSVIPQKIGTGWEKRLLDGMIATEKASGDAEDLADIFPKDPELAAIYYKMLKGTNQYDVGQRKGVPPLADFMTLEEEKKENTIHFAFASYPLLKALFGVKIAAAIDAAEKRELEETGKYLSLDKEELQALVLQNAAEGTNFSAMEPYMNFTKAIPKKKILAGKDQQTGMTVKRKCN